MVDYNVRPGDTTNSYTLDNWEIYDMVDYICQHYLIGRSDKAAAFIKQNIAVCLFDLLVNFRLNLSFVNIYL